ncbi:hypothetical protein ASE26_20470 [Duganella sp. Root198D2]|nr:hypothetical protein ASD07_24095 [Duganella sp. Root336D2]KRC01406.1 hypothetical protein ASE26_20470 [Duganella sp. Root198D2]
MMRAGTFVLAVLVLGGRQDTCDRLVTQSLVMKICFCKRQAMRADQINGMIDDRCLHALMPTLWGE